jgi:hypothetical protein
MFGASHATITGILQVQPDEKGNDLVEHAVHHRHEAAEQSQDAAQQRPFLPFGEPLPAGCRQQTTGRRRPAGTASPGASSRWLASNRARLLRRWTCRVSAANTATVSTTALSQDMPPAAASRAPMGDAPPGQNSEYRPGKAAREPCGKGGVIWNIGTTTRATAASRMPPQPTRPQPRCIAVSCRRQCQRSVARHCQQHSQASSHAKPINASFRPWMVGLVDRTPTSA